MKEDFYKADYELSTMYLATNAPKYEEVKMDFVSNLFEESIALPQMSLKNCPNLYSLFEKDNIDHTDVLNNVGQFFRDI
jgi:hypothetical protein